MRVLANVIVSRHNVDVGADMDWVGPSLHSAGVPVSSFLSSYTMTSKKCKMQQD